MFVVGVQITSEKDRNKVDESGEATSLAGKDAESSLVNNDGQGASPIDPDYDPISEPETEEKPSPELQKEPEQGFEVEPESPEPPKTNPGTSYPDYPQNSNEWYRVRTSAGSDGKQDGAFKSFANAKAHATTLKAQGYKVYDNNMKCIYTP